MTPCVSAAHEGLQPRAKQRRVVRCSALLGAAVRLHPVSETSGCAGNRRLHSTSARHTRRPCSLALERVLDRAEAAMVDAGEVGRSQHLSSHRRRERNHSNPCTRRPSEARANQLLPRCDHPDTCLIAVPKSGAFCGDRAPVKHESSRAPNVLGVSCTARARVPKPERRGGCCRGVAAATTGELQPT